jgi:hypothetical protein
MKKLMAFIKKCVCYFLAFAVINAVVMSFFMSLDLPPEHFLLLLAPLASIAITYFSIKLSQRFNFSFSGNKTRADHKINNGRLNLFIEYQAANDDKTERDIIVYGRTPFQPRGELRAFCELRQDFRTFKLNRIQTMVNKATGEVIQNKQKFIDDFYS